MYNAHGAQRLIFLSLKATEDGEHGDDRSENRKSEIGGKQSVSKD